jgi:hypothetical protein
MTLGIKDFSWFLELANPIEQLKFSLLAATSQQLPGSIA